MTFCFFYIFVLVVKMFWRIFVGWAFLYLVWNIHEIFDFMLIFFWARSYRKEGKTSESFLRSQRIFITQRSFFFLQLYFKVWNFLGLCFGGCSSGCNAIRASVKWKRSRFQAIFRPLGGGGGGFTKFSIFTQFFYKFFFFAKICLKFFLNWFQFKIWNYSINSKENLVIIFRIKKNPEFKFSVTNK